ncbi:glycosyltransferase family 39 protein [Sphingomonas sp. BT-65]|uniref:glycosyltransferase family 39 protein n=1 Tax=Sphingomonas sp. BT-65 TaxID=2989821 RepID=UPI00223678DE|nr:glycosyltransferase family 39 protein [Sphingomonas sp. BT-65]MCW4463435.1 glycosyltransferase family 39 protein [Sphingomonas sp. BT-65]
MTSPDRLDRAWRIAAWAAGALCLLALFARIMTYPLQHDEQFYVSAGVLFGQYPLYSGIGFTHLPNIALLYAGAFALFGDAHYLLIGRLLTFAAWVATFAALLLIARTYVRSALIGGLMIALLVLNPMFLNATGMAATNNFLPVPFMLFGLYLFLRAADRSQPAPALALASGFLLAVAAGFKANYVLLLIPFGVAALLVPPDLPLRSRLLRVALPLLVGGIVGGLPSIIYALDDPQGFVTHVFSAHRGPQLGYWAAHPDPTDPKVIGIAGKLLLAHRLWLSGVPMLMLVLLLSFLTIAFVRRETLILRWPHLLVAGLAAIGAIISFVPTPSFAQYFAPPLPFAIVLIGLLFGALDPPGRNLTRPLVAAVLALTAVTGAPLLLPSLAGLASPGGWTGIRVARDGAAIATLVRKQPGNGPVATLSPIHALEGHLPIYPHFALGQFMVRAAQWVPEDERRHYAYFVTPGAIPSLLAAQPPAAILTGMDGDTEAALDAFARDRGYRVIPLSLKNVEDAERVRLYLPR